MLITSRRPRYAVVIAALAVCFGCLFCPTPSWADTLSELYGNQFDRAQVLSAGENPDEPEAQDQAESNSADQNEDNGIALFAASPRARSISPRSIPSEMLYFCKWESGQNYDQGLSWGDGYHALGYFQFDNRYDLGSFLQAVYYYNPSKYSCLAIIGSRYSWDVNDATRSNGAFTQLGNDLNSVWHACYKADPTEFSQLQNDWAYTQYYDGVTGIRGSMQAFGINIDNRSDSVKSLVWGMANLFGQGGGRSYAQSGLYYGVNWFIKNSEINGAMDDEQLVTTLCDFVVNNVARRYPGQPEYWNGWQNRYRDEKTHYLSVMKKWVYENGNWYWQTISDGTRSKGWAYINGTWYYLDPTTGAMQTGWVKIGETWYWMDASGAMKSGWLLLSGTWYWLDSSGAMATGWKELSGTWYWFDATSGAMASSRALTGNLWSDFTNSGIWTGYASGWDLRDGSCTGSKTAPELRAGVRLPVVGTGLTPAPQRRRRTQRHASERAPTPSTQIAEWGQMVGFSPTESGIGPIRAETLQRVGLGLVELGIGSTPRILPCELAGPESEAASITYRLQAPWTQAGSTPMAAGIGLTPRLAICAQAGNSLTASGTTWTWTPASCRPDGLWLATTGITWTQVEP